MNDISRPLSSINISNSIFIWHQNLGHMPFKKLKQLPSIKNEIIDSCCISECLICPLAKQARSLFSLSNSKAPNIFSLLNVDLWGPYNHNTYYFIRLFLTIVDDYSIYTWIYMLKLKDDIVCCLKELFSYIKNHFFGIVQIVMFDNCREFFNQGVDCLLKSLGIVHQSNSVNMPVQNTVVAQAFI